MRLISWELIEMRYMKRLCLLLSMLLVFSGLGINVMPVCAETITYPIPDSTLQGIPRSGGWTPLYSSLAPSGSSSGKSNSLSNNIVTVNGGAPNYVFGAVNSRDSDAVTYNQVIINGYSSIRSVYGGYVNIENGFASTIGNSVTVNGGTIDSEVNGGCVYNYYSGSSVSSNNSVTITSGTIGYRVLGGYTQQNSSGSATSNGNSVIITGGTVNSYVMGGCAVVQAGFATSTDNNITITGGMINTSIYCGYAQASSSNTILTATNNNMTIYGTPDLSNASIYGGFIYVSAGDAIGDQRTGNTLNVRNSAMSVKGIYNFENLNFYLPESMTAGGTMLNVTDFVDISNSKIGVGINGYTSALNVGDTVTLIGTVAGINTTGINTYAIIDTQGIAKFYSFDLTVDDFNLYAKYIGESDNPQSKALTEGQLGGLAFLNQGFDLISGTGIDNALHAAEKAQDITGFAAMGGGSQRYKTGSHIDVNGFSMMAGVVKKMQGITAGAFLEGGWGNYYSFNSFNYVPSVNGNGNTNYYGLGVLGRYAIDETWYGEGSLRIGSTKTDFNSADFIGYSNVSYETSAMYYGAHLGVGWLHNLNETLGLDLSAKLFYTRQGGDNLTIESDKVEFNAANSMRTRLGGRVSHAMNRTLMPYAGAFLDYEFSGKAKAKINGSDIDSPDLKGATGIGELGMEVSPTNLPLTLDIGLQGYVGTRQGFSASLQACYKFGFNFPERKEPENKEKEVKKSEKELLKEQNELLKKQIELLQQNKSEVQ